jgi:hypothetical protein
MKKIFFLKVILVLTALWGLAPKSAYCYDPKEGNVSAIFGPYVYKTNYAGSTSGVNSPWMAAPSMIVQGDVTDYSSLEIAFFHMNKIFVREEGGRYLAEQTQTLHTTFGYRYWYNPYLSFSVALFTAYTMGEPKIVHSDFTPPDYITTSARDIVEYGLDLSIEQELMSFDYVNVVADLRYSFSVTNKISEIGDHYGILIGIKYLFQERYKRDSSYP